LDEEAGEEGEVVADVEDDAGGDGVCGDTDDAKDDTDAADEEDRSPGVRNLLGVHEGEGNRGEQDGERDTKSPDCAFADDLFALKPAKDVDEAGEEESAEGELFREGSEGDAEGHEGPGASGGLGEVLENGRRFGHREEVAGEGDAEAGEDAESGEGEGPAESGGEIPVDSFKEGAIPPEGEDERGECPEDDIDGRLHRNGVDDVAADLLHEHGNADVRMRGVDGKEGDEVSANEGGKNEQDENENVADVGDEPGLWRLRHQRERRWRRRGALDRMPEVAGKVAGDRLRGSRDRFPGKFLSGQIVHGVGVAHWMIGFLGSFAADFRRRVRLPFAAGVAMVLPWNALEPA
jgi:hypothetical protein